MDDRSIRYVSRRTLFETGLLAALVVLAFGWYQVQPVMDRLQFLLRLERP